MPTRKRKPPIDYTDPATIAARRAAKLEQRRQATEGAWAIGQFIVADGVICFTGVARQPDWSIDDNAALVHDVARMARWSTRQAARQWLIRHPRAEECRLLNLQSLARRPSCRDDNTAAAAPAASSCSTASELSPRQRGLSDGNAAALSDRQRALA